MSMNTGTKIPNLSTDQLPILPETYLVEPIVECGVLYLGTAPSSVDLYGLDAIQEPFSHQYPVDGTNTVRGIDAILSVYDNGIQLSFTRDPRAVIFFPINSLIYCASLRFSIIENDSTRPTSTIGWRFMPLNTLTVNESKHPPLFCAVIQRTRILSGDECHCFITKSSDTAFTLVRTISQVRANLTSKTICLKSPIFYQLDCFGRRIRETTGVIYLSPAKHEDSQLNRVKPTRLIDKSIARHYLFDPSFGGFFYRTNASRIEEWQLWDTDNIGSSRPHPPASPFGLHEGLYHDDTTHEIQRFLRHLDHDGHSCSCSCSSESSSSDSVCSASSCSPKSSSTDSISTEYTRRQRKRRRNTKKSMDHNDQVNALLLKLQTSSFEPISIKEKLEPKIKRKAPIIIEKVVPKPVTSIPILNPKSPQPTLNPPNSGQESKPKYMLPSDSSSDSYHINERGEKITKEGNRIVFMDVIRPNINNNQMDLPPNTPLTSHSRSHQQRSPKHIPVIDIETVERLYNEKKSKDQRRTSQSSNEKSKDDSKHKNHSITSDILEIIDQYIEDDYGHEIKMNNHEFQSVLTQSKLPSTNKQQRANSIMSSTNSSKSGSGHHRSHSTVTSSSSFNYGKRSSIPSLSQSQASTTAQQKSSTSSISTTDQINTFVSDIYGTCQSIKSSSSIVPEKPSTSPMSTSDQINTFVSDIYGTCQSTKSSSPSSTYHQEINPMDNTIVIDASYISAFRYMQSSVNSNLLQTYFNAY